MIIGEKAEYVTTNDARSVDLDARVCIQSLPVALFFPVKRLLAKDEDWGHDVFFLLFLVLQSWGMNPENAEL